MTQPFPSTRNLYPGIVNTKRYMPPALPGMVNGEGTFQCYPYVNNVGMLEQWSLTLPTTPTSSATYKFGVNGYAIAVTTDADATQTELATLLLSAIRADAQLFSEIEVDVDGSNNFTIWARQIGKTLAVTINPSGEVAAPLVVSKTQSTVVGGVIPFGRFVGRKSTYFRDPLDGYGSASLINATSGFDILGVTLAANYLQKVGRFQDAQEGYPFDTTMDVMNDTGSFKGVWIECVEPDIAIGDTPYIAVTSGNEGKLTKTSSGAIALGSSVSIRSGTQTTFGNRLIVLCKIKLAV